MNCKMTNELFSIIKLLLNEQKTPKDYGTGQLLYHSEVVFIDAIFRLDAPNVSQLSRTLDITKGAVTQTAKKLSEKSLIEIYMLEKNKKEKYFRLTTLGETVRVGHESFHKAANDSLCAYFCSLSEEESEVIKGFLNKLKECVPFGEITCNNSGCKT